MTSVNGHRADATNLTGVSETALLTLRARANEARRHDAIIDDPMAIKLMDSIDYDFSKFGVSSRQDLALGALPFDNAACRYLAAHPCATVVALAEGLQTSFWRLDEAGVGHDFRWLTVDLPPIIELRRTLLPRSPRTSVRPQSALDYSWMDTVDRAPGVFITTEGLLMYLQPDHALGLIRDCAQRFPGGQLMFDLPPAWFSALVRHGFRTALRYRVPPMPFSLSIEQIASLASTVPGIRAVHDVALPRGRGALFNLALWTAQRLPVFDPVRPALTLLEFG
jgi:O-methyltransferase involved in polyketide biosynthesis